MIFPGGSHWFLVDGKREVNMALQYIYQPIISLDMDSVTGLVQKELDQGTDVSVILKEGLIAALDEVGERFSSGEMFLPEMLKGAQVMKMGLEVIRPLLSEADTYTAGTVVIETIKGDLHDIGKDLVAMMMEGAGFRVIDLGIDVATDVFMKAIEENRPDIIGLSALLTTTMPAMSETVSHFKEADIRAKVIIGGAPVSQGFADEIGADGYSDDAPGAVVLARKLLSG